MTTPKPPIWENLPEREVVPRDQTLTPRCPECSSPDSLRPESPPMRHPRHQWSACQVPLPGGEPCGCEHRGQ